MKAFRKGWDTEKPPAATASMNLPPEMLFTFPLDDRRYSQAIAAGATLPMAENYQDLVARVKPFWEEVKPVIRAGTQVVIVCHANTIRAFHKILEGVSVDIICTKSS